MKIAQQKNLRTYAMVAAALAAAGCSGSQSVLPGRSMPSSAILRSAIGPETKSTVYGELHERYSGLMIAGAKVLIGNAPDIITCIGYTGCGHPLAPLFGATTDAKGRFSLRVPTGTWFLQITHSGYAELHCAITVSGSRINLGVRSISLMRPYETRMLAILNHDRRTISKPRTPGDLVEDEYALEQDRDWEDDIASGQIPWDDPHYVPPKDGVGPGADAAAAVQFYCCDSTLGMDGYFNEKKNCPHGRWVGCPWANDTGHYIVLSSDTDAWVGLTRSSRHQKDMNSFDQGGMVLGGYGSHYKT